VQSIESSTSDVWQKEQSHLSGEYHKTLLQDNLLYFGTERIRVAEVVWQPSLLGSTQMGLSEAIAYLLHRLWKESSSTTPTTTNTNTNTNTNSNNVNNTTSNK
jgi:hypothetical protein